MIEITNIASKHIILIIFRVRSVSYLYTLKLEDILFILSLNRIKQHRLTVDLIIRNLKIKRSAPIMLFNSTCLLLYVFMPSKLRKLVIDGYDTIFS